MSPTTAFRRESVRCCVLTIGDELLAGDIVDGNKAILASRARALGIDVIRAFSVRDRKEEIVETLREIAPTAELCLVSGGLGPTTDDLTAEAVAAAAGVALVRDEATAQALHEFFATRGAELVQANLCQADIPEGASVLDNPIGTAPGFALELSTGSHRCLVACMPGVPRELERMMTEQVEPRLRERFMTTPVLRRVHRVVGIGESAVHQRIEAMLKSARTRSPGLGNMFVHYRAGASEVQICLEALPIAEGEHRGVTATEAELASLDGAFAEALAPGYVGTGNQELCARLVTRLLQLGLTVATAESCTGGLVGQLLTSVPGSSGCFRGGVIAYTNEVKRELLEVPGEKIESHGAVSEPVARAMAIGARRALRSDLAVAITGIAGPGGGTVDKPVGTVDLAISDAHGTSYLRLHLRGNRAIVRRAAALRALKLLWDRLVEHDSSPT